MFQKIQVTNMKDMPKGSPIKLSGSCRYGTVSVFSAESVLKIEINGKPVLMLPTIVPELSIAEIFGLTDQMFEWKF